MKAELARTHSIIDLCTAPGYVRTRAAEILTETFTARGVPAWPDLASARREVRDCCTDSRVVLGVLITPDRQPQQALLAAWGGLQRMYDDATWELHPLVVDQQYQGRGLGGILLDALEQRAREAGVLNICLGTDDEYQGTSISGFDPRWEDLGRAITGIRSLKNHPYQFYQKQGYHIVGIIPHANGPGKPDILMWKQIQSTA